MYSWEIDNYIKEKNYYLSTNDFLKVTNIKENPQIARIRFNPYSNDYEMWTYDNYYWRFGVYYEKIKYKK